VEQLSRRSGTDELEVAERAIAAAERARHERPMPTARITSAIT
jgi:hypothetical protein